MPPVYRVASSTCCQDSWVAQGRRTNSDCRTEFALVWCKLAKIFAVLAVFNKTIWEYIISVLTGKKNKQGTQDFTKWNVSIPCKFYKIGNHFNVSNYFSRFFFLFWNSISKPCLSKKSVLINLVLIWKIFKKYNNEIPYDWNFIIFLSTMKHIQNSCYHLILL